MTQRGPGRSNYQNTLTLKVEAQLSSARNLLHGKRRSNLKLKIREDAARREKAVQEGKLAKAIKSITGQHQHFYNVDSLLLSDDKIITYPIQIHSMLTDAFAERFICQQQHKHSLLQSDNT